MDKFGIHLLLTHEQHEALRQIAFDRRVSIAALVREAVEQFLKNQPATPAKKKGE